MQAHVLTWGLQVIQECDPNPTTLQLRRCENASATFWTDRWLQDLLGLQSSFTEDTADINALEDRNTPVPEFLRWSKPDTVHGGRFSESLNHFSQPSDSTEFLQINANIKYKSPLWSQGNAKGLCCKKNRVWGLHESRQIKFHKSKLHKKLGEEEFQQMRYLASRKGPAKHLQMSLLFLLQIRTIQSYPRKAALLVPWVFFTKSNLLLYFISPVFYHPEMCYYSETVGVSVCSSWAGVGETGVRAGVRAGTGAYFVDYIFDAGKYEHPQSSVLLYRLAKADFCGFLPLMFAFFKGYFFFFMYKTPSPYWIRWEKAFTSPGFEFFCWILFFISMVVNGL